MVAEPALFQPIPIRNLDLANRIVIAPMCQYSAEGGCMNSWHLIHLGQLALSGAALTAVFSMRWVRGFDDQILAALKSADPEIHHEAVNGAENWMRHGLTSSRSPPTLQLPSTRLVN